MNRSEDEDEWWLQVLDAREEKRETPTSGSHEPERRKGKRASRPTVGPLTKPAELGHGMGQGGSGLGLRLSERGKGMGMGVSRLA